MLFSQVLKGHFFVLSGGVWFVFLPDRSASCAAGGAEGDARICGWRMDGGREETGGDAGRFLAAGGIERQRPRADGYFRGIFPK